MHLHAIDIPERIYRSVDIDGRREENLDGWRISRAHETSSDETRGEISEENTKKNQEQGMYNSILNIRILSNVNVSRLRNYECDVKDTDFAFYLFLDISAGITKKEEGIYG